MSKLCIVYHCVFQIEGNPLPAAEPIIRDQMTKLWESKLLDECDQFIVGVNGGVESQPLARLIIPAKALIVYHGTECRNENLTLLLLEQWVKEHDDDWLVLYHHSKGATRPIGEDFSTRWRECMQHHLVTNWRQCVEDLKTVESVGCHWMTGDQTPPGQSIFAGNFWWARASYLRTLPSIMERDRIKVSGIGSYESRYESEVFIGNGPRLPTLKDYCPGWVPGMEHVKV